MSVYSDMFGRLLESGKLKLRCDSSAASTLRRTLFKLNKEYNETMAMFDESFIPKALSFKYKEGLCSMELKDRVLAETARFTLVSEDDEDV